MDERCSPLESLNDGTYPGDVDTTAVRWYVEAIAAGTADNGHPPRPRWIAPPRHPAPPAASVWSDALTWSLLGPRLAGVLADPI